MVLSVESSKLEINNRVGGIMNNKTILIIDDDKSMLESVLGILQDEGYMTFTTTSGEEGIGLVDAGFIDLVVAEIWLPDLDGISIFREIRKKHENLPVIMISRHANLDTVFQAGKMGVTDFLEKPVSLDKLLIMIKRAFKKPETNSGNTP